MKATKKIIAVMMAVLMFIVPLCTVNASAATSKIKRDCPNIEVHGFMTGSILENKDDPNSDVIWPPNVKDILGEIGKALPKMMGLIPNFSWDDFANIVSDAAYKIMGKAFANDKGEIDNNSGVYFKYPKAKTIKKNSEVKFSYDWRVDPLETAEKLNDYINYVLKCSGSDKVTIECHSFGGIVTLSYISLYGTSKLKGVCFNSTAIYGESYNGDLMTGKITLNSESLTNYLDYAFDSNDAETLLDGIVNLANKAGLLDKATDLGNTLADNIIDVAAKKVLVPMFGSWLPIWAMVPDEDLDEAMAYVFDNVYAGENHNALKAKINRYNKLVRKNKTRKLKQTNKEINVYVISRYGYSSLPLTPSYNEIGDGVVDTKYTSFGATTSDYGSCLSNKYIKNINPRYISPDKTVDASTCLFPKQTWFIKNMKHSTSPDQLDYLIDSLLAYKGQANVKTFKDYPRFLTYDGRTETISIDTGVVESANSSSKFKDILSTVTGFIKSIF